MAHVYRNNDGRLVAQESDRSLTDVHRKHNAPRLKRLRPLGRKLVEGRGNMSARFVQELRGDKREHEDVPQVGGRSVGAQESFCPNSAIVRPTEVKVFRACDACIDDLDWTTADGNLVTELRHRRVHQQGFHRGGADFWASVEVQPRQVFFVAILGIRKDGRTTFDEDPKLLLRHLWN
eukprot:scaffold3676_cov152-Pinguiococcus_pyrenoidosus.AAC.7